MKVVFKVPDGRYYIAYVYQSKTDYEVRSLFVGKDGKVSNRSFLQKIPTLERAKSRFRMLRRIKRNRPSWHELEIKDAPNYVRSYFPIVSGVIERGELIDLLEVVEYEVLVVINNNTGLEDHFDCNVEYLGYTSGNEYFINIYDKCGELTPCMWDRVLSHEKSERATDFINNKGYYSHLHSDLILERDERR